MSVASGTVQPPFLGFLIRLALDTKRGHRPGVEPLDADIGTAALANPVAAVDDALERLVDLRQQLALPVANPQQRVSVRLEGSPIGGVRKGLAAVGHAADGAAGFVENLLAPALEELLEPLQLPTVHGYEVLPEGRVPTTGTTTCKARCAPHGTIRRRRDLWDEARISRRSHSGLTDWQDCGVNAPIGGPDLEHEVSRFVLPVPGATLGGVSVGPASARPLLVVHGGPGESHDVLRPHLDALASAARRVVYYDQRGGGGSALDAGAAPAAWQRHVADLDAVRTHCAAGPIDVLGFSWGALLAVLHAIGHREHLARLVLVSPAPMHAAASRSILRALEAARARPAARDVESHAGHQAIAASTEALRAQARFVARIACCLAHPEQAWDLSPVDAREDVVRAVWESLGDYDLRPRLGNLRGLPTLVVAGAEDPVVSATVTDTAERLGARLALVDRCGHAPFFEAPNIFTEIVASFLTPAPASPL